MSFFSRVVTRAQTLPPVAVDAVIAVACLANAVIQSIVNERFFWYMPLVAGAASAALLWRRRYPFWVTQVVGVCTIVQAMTGALGDLPPAQLVVTYTFAALCPPKERLIAAAGTFVGVMLSVGVPQEKVLNLGLVGIAFTAAYALGVGARARRDRIAMLEERAARLAEGQVAAATRERERIAREMHDIMAHSMSMVVIQAEAGPVAVRTDPDKAEEVFDTISETAREALAQLRRALGVLRAEEGGASRRPPPGLEALPALVDDVRHAGLEATLEVDGEPRPVPSDLAVTAYRIVQEALTNTVRHAAADQVRVRLSWRDGALDVEVRDDGRGAFGGGGGGAGLGLVGMRERVAASGGELAAGPGPGGDGYRVTASLPLA
ncbi:sensor histidine kinase [Actinomadura rugatobispora]|uniref:sensor histidine kinase n=1 Tax=Actinomadura rugatobispora TaxID=1994 RepID=UPI003670749C